jgi:hypothetical protein
MELLKSLAHIISYHIVARTATKITRGLDWKLDLFDYTQLQLQCTHFTIHYSTLHCLHSAATLDYSLWTASLPELWRLILLCRLSTGICSCTVQLQLSFTCRNVCCMCKVYIVSIFRFLKISLHDSRCFNPAVYLTAPFWKIQILLVSSLALSKVFVDIFGNVINCKGMEKFEAHEVLWKCFITQSLLWCDICEQFAYSNKLQNWFDSHKGICRNIFIL